MFYIDTEKCNGCGACVAVCPQRAIDLIGANAVVNHRVCKECGNCLEVCSAGAIYEEVKEPQFIRIQREPQVSPRGKEVINMPYGYGYGRGFGFRGSSPPWPYVGRGRGGLPKCYYPGAAWDTPNFGGAYFPGSTPYPAPMSREQQTGFLREEANAIKARLEEIEGRIKELDSEQK